MQNRRLAFRRVAFCLALAYSLSEGGHSPYLGADDRKPSMPDLPRPQLNSLVPGIRAQVQKVYDAAVANPLDPSANGKLGMILHANSFLPEAEISYSRAHLLEPNSFRWLYYLGVAQMDQAKCNEAESTFKAVIRLDADYLPAQLRLGECLVVSQDWEGAGKLYEAFIKKHPENAEAHYGLGKVRVARKDLNGAVESFRKACELFPKFAAAHFALARAYQHLDQRDKAQAELTLSKQTGGALPEIGDKLLADVGALVRDYNADVKLGIELGGQGKFKDAADAFEEALSINPQLYEAHSRLIYIYGQLRQFPKAEEHYQAAARLDPKKVEAYFNYGMLLMGQGRTQEAEGEFRKVLTIDPHHSRGHNSLGYLLEGEGKLAEAMGEFRKAIEDSPDLAQAHFALGRILVKQENYQEGIPHLLKAVATEEEENKASYLYATGLAFAAVGDLRDGLRYLRLAREKAAIQRQANVLKSIDDDLRLLTGGGSTP